jgi:putative SOS response-associated peptidase YedK
VAVAGLIGINAEKMELVDALQKGRWELEAWNPRPVVRLTNRIPVARREGAEVVLRAARWGFPIGPSRPVGNARDDRLLESPLWRGLLETGRCLVAATGVFEMVKGEEKRYYWFRRADGRLLVMPGLCGERGVGDEVRLCAAIVTTAPNRFFAQFHERQVATLSESEAAAWLSAPDASSAVRFLHGPAEDEWEAVPVSARVFAHDRRDAEGVPVVGAPIRWNP